MWNLSSCHGAPEDPRSTDLPGRGRPGAASVLRNCGWGRALEPRRRSWKRALPGAACSCSRNRTHAQPHPLQASFLTPPAGGPRQPGCGLGRTHSLSPPASLLPRGEIHPSLSTHDRCLPPGGYLGRDRTCLPGAHMGGAPTLTHPRVEAGEGA